MLRKYAAGLQLAVPGFIPAMAQEKNTLIISENFSVNPVLIKTETKETYLVKRITAQQMWNSKSTAGCKPMEMQSSQYS